MLMTEKERTRLSKFLSLVLRHQPGTIGIELDEQGWVPVTMLLKKITAYGNKINMEMLREVVDSNDKKRFAFSDDGRKIRASQGHSVEIDLGYAPQEPPELLYHGTATRHSSSIMKAGLEKRNRSHVHLSSNIESVIAVGSRHGEPMVFEVAAGKMYAHGFLFYLSENGVWLTDAVLAIYLFATF